MSRLDSLIRELSPEESRRLFRTYLLEFAELSSHVHSLKSSRTQAESERDDVKSELARVRKTIEVLKKSFSNALMRQKGKYERELVSLLPSVEGGLAGDGLGSGGGGGGGAGGAGSGAGAGAGAGAAGSTGASSNQLMDDSDDGSGRARTGGGGGGDQRRTLFPTSSSSDLRVSGMIDNVDVEDTPLMSTVLTSLQQQVSGLTQELAVYKEANQQMK